MRFFCIPMFACQAGASETLDFSQKRLDEVPREVLKARKHIEELLLNVRFDFTLKILNSNFGKTFPNVTAMRCRFGIE